MRISLLAAFAILLAFNIPATAQSGQTVVNNMLAAISKVKNMTFTVHTKERINGKFVEEKSLFKIQVSPRQLYMKGIAPNNGLEVLYKEGWNGNECLINPNGFPYVNVSFSPRSSKMRDGHHHTVLESGLDYVGKNVRGTMKLITDQGGSIDDFFKILGEKTYDGKLCYELSMVNDRFEYKPYTVPQTIALEDLAQQRNISAYLVKEKNNLGWGNISAGKTILLPNSYAKKVIFYIEKSTNLPLAQFVYDEKGLFEQYEFYNLKINMTFATDVFSPDNAAYNF